MFMSFGKIWRSIYLIKKKKKKKQTIFLQQKRTFLYFDLALFDEETFRIYVYNFLDLYTIIYENEVQNILSKLDPRLQFNSMMIDKDWRQVWKTNGIP